MPKRGLLFVLLLLSLLSAAQRTYVPHSVLAAGTVYRLGIRATGVYKIDVSFLNSIGIATSGLPSSTIRLFGNGGAPLPEANNVPRPDDLREIAITVVDGGDGQLNGNDYILFYAEGPEVWTKDSVNQRFNHVKNPYATQSRVFLSVGGPVAGLRMASAGTVSGASTTITTYSGCYFHELDTVNFLSSGRQWYGEEFSDLPGRTTSRQFSIPIPYPVAGTSLIYNAQYVSRSIGSGSRFDTKINTQVIGQSTAAPVTGGLYDPFAQPVTANFATVTPGTPLSLTINYVPGSFNAQGWLNWFEVFTRNELNISGQDQLLFRDWASVGPGNVVTFELSGADATTTVWDITEPWNALQMPASLAGGQLRFANTASRLREYVAFGTKLLVPENGGRVAVQDLHASNPADLLIVTHPALLSQAQRLAQWHHDHDGLRCVAVTTDQVFNEFGGGIADPGAIRDFAKMYFDKYGSDPASRPRYLLLLGDASFDYLGKTGAGGSMVPGWESAESLDPLTSYVSDDFFGFLDNQEDINSGLVLNQLDLGIGRVPAASAEDAKNFVDKVIAYGSSESLGPWRNNSVFIADDEDNNLHLQDAELLTATAASTDSLLNQQKIYLDAFVQETGAGGASYPAVNTAINNQVYSGALLINYNGHGGSARLADETILDQEAVDGWTNGNKLPLFITATCDFAPYDNPRIRSLGEDMLLRATTGGIALMTTTRVVFAFSNRVLNNNYLQYALKAGADGRFRSLGDAVMDAKNFTYQTSGDVANNRKFTLLGDPALTLAFPSMRVGIVQVNGIVPPQVDTLKATEKVRIEGEVQDLQGNRLTGFNGAVYPVVFDKPAITQTIGNDAGSQPAPFQTQSAVLFRGEATVQAGRFSIEFRVPKDINYQPGYGRLSLYAENGQLDASGLFTRFIIGGAGNDAGADHEGPEIHAYLNDDRFVNGSITNARPVLLVKLADSSGINTAGTGIGHDLVATLDNDNRLYYILNDFYQGDRDSYRSGQVRFQLPELAAGPHSLHIKAWDVLNNSNEAVLDFLVVNDEELRLEHVLNYPNPFTTSTRFGFEHNKPGLDLDARVQIYTISGKLIKTIRQTINTTGNRSMELEWNGIDEFGDKVARGVYLYKLTIRAPGGLKKEKIEKLVIL